MRFNRTQSIAIVLIGMLLLAAACAESKSERESLPRSFGPLTLGMTQDQFKKITGLAKEDYCANCADEQSMVSIEVEKFPGLYPAYLYSLPESARVVSASFYRGKLYLIETSPEFDQIGAAKEKLSEKYGPPKLTDWKNGLSFASWEDKTTAMVLTYVRQQDRNQGYPLTMPAGNVSSIEFIDKLVRSDLEAHEKQKATRDLAN